MFLGRRRTRRIPELGHADFVSLDVTTEEPEVTLILEPWGIMYPLKHDDVVRINVHERQLVEDRPDLADIDIVHGARSITLYLPNFVARNKAGDEVG